MTLVEMQAALAEVSVPDFAFEIVERRAIIYDSEVLPLQRRASEPATDMVLLLRGHYKEGDIVTGDVMDQYTRKWLLSEHMVKSELVQTAFKCYLTSLEHRAREHFLYRGRRVFGPHFDVDALWQICKTEHLDYRDKDKT